MKAINYNNVNHNLVASLLIARIQQPQAKPPINRRFHK
jgi:hypothetical protein